MNFKSKNYNLGAKKFVCLVSLMLHLLLSVLVCHHCNIPHNYAETWLLGHGLQNLFPVPLNETTELKKTYGIIEISLSVFKK